MPPHFQTDFKEVKEEEEREGQRTQCGQTKGTQRLSV